MCCWAVGADALDEDSPHHLSTTQSAAHSSASHYADTQGLTRCSSQLHTGTHSRRRGKYTHIPTELKKKKASVKYLWLDDKCTVCLLYAS